MSDKTEMVTRDEVVESIGEYVYDQLLQGTPQVLLDREIKAKFPNVYAPTRKKGRYLGMERYAFIHKEVIESREANHGLQVARLELMFNKVMSKEQPSASEIRVALDVHKELSVLMGIKTQDFGGGGTTVNVYGTDALDKLKGAAGNKELADCDDDELKRIIKEGAPNAVLDSDEDIIDVEID